MNPVASKPKRCAPRKRLKRIKRWIVAVWVRGAAALWCMLPHRWALALGSIVGAAAFHIAGPPRRLAIEQVRTALGVSPAEARGIVRRLFTHLGLVVAEIATMPKLLRRIEEYVVLPEASKAVCAEALAEGRGVVLVTAHLGNWELMAQRLFVVGWDVLVVARPNPNPYLGRWLSARRRRAGLPLIDRGEPGVPREILKALKQNRVIGFLIDQDTDVQSTFVPFFGRQAKTPVAPARLALRRNAPVLASFIRRTQTGHEICVERIDLSGIDVDDRDAAAQVATERMTVAIESAVREAPEEWVWFHRRWKSRAGASN